MGIFPLPITDLTCTGIMATEYINDTTLPHLRSFTVDMDTGTFVLSFSETVNISTFNPTNLTLIDTAAPEPLTRYTIRNNGTLMTLDDSPIITFQLDEDDLNAIKLDTGLFSAMATSFISLTPDAVIDMSNNFIFALNFSAAIQASNYTFDETPPELENYELDLNAGAMTLSFNEAVNLLNFNPAVITLKNAYENATRSYTIEGVRASETLSDLGKVVTFSLTVNDQDHLKAYTDFATNRNNTFLIVTSGLITDVSRLNNRNIPINDSDPLMAFEVHDDRIPPLLNEFLEFNLGSRSFLHLSFNEPVSVSSILFDRIIILAGPGSSNNHSLINGTASYVDDSLNKEVDIELSLESILAIKLNTGLATERDDTHISLLTGSIQDQAGNDIFRSDTVVTDVYVGDTDGPEALGFILNIDKGTLLLSFNDVVEVNTLIITGIAIQADSDGSAVDDFVQFDALPTFEATTSPNGLEILINIPPESLNLIKANQQLATNRNTSFLTISATTIDDLAGNPAVAFVREAALPASGYVGDTTSPELVSFVLDIDGTGTLGLTFTEAVVQLDLEPSEIVLVGTNNERFALSSRNYPTFPPLSSFNIVLGGVISSVTTPDLDDIKALPNLASTESNVNITISHLAVKDTSGNNVSEIFNTSLPITIGGFTLDTTRPKLVSFTLNMNNGLLNLSFSETVNGSSFNPQAITLRRSREFLASSHTLSGGHWKHLYQNYIELTLSTADMNEIKRILDLANSLNTTFMSFTEDMVVDMSSGVTESERQSNAVIPQELFEALQASEYQIDETSPEIVAFSLNLTSEVLALTFDETVNASSLQIDVITILSWPLDEGADNISEGSSGSGSASGVDVGSTSGSGELLYQPEVVQMTNLTVGGENSSFSTSTDGTVIIIQLGSNDLNSLKVQVGLATSIENTYLSFTESLIADTSLNEPTNLVTPITPEMAFQADSFFNDFVAPELVRFDLNLSSGHIDLTFSEVVNASSIDLTALTLQGAFDISLEPAADVWSLTVGFNGSRASQDDSTKVAVYLGWRDLNEIKRLTGLATDTSSTYITLTSNAIRDMNGNAVVPLIDGVSSLPIAFFTPDVIRPDLHVFNIDMDSGILTLEFTETVLAESLNTTQITLLSSHNERDVQLHTLTSDSLTTSRDNTTIDIILSEEDLNAIKFLTELAQDENSTFLSILMPAVTDMNSNDVFGIPPNDSLMVSTYFRDETGPVLRTFDLNLTAETLTLHFDETVNISSIDYTGLTLLSSFSNSVINYTLMDGLINGENTPDVVIVLNFTDLNALKLEPSLATGKSNTHLYFREGTIFDLAMEPNRASEKLLRVSTHENDLTNPNLVAFSADINLGTLTLNFDEPVNASTLDPTGITLLNSVDEDIELTLTGGNTTSENGLQIVIFVTEDDLNDIKVFETLYTMDMNVFIALEPSTISDMNNNPVNTISALNATAFTNDTTSPKLRAFDLDFDSNILSLEFVETVNTSSINFTGITLQADSNSNNTYTLTGGILLSHLDSTIVQFELLRVDSNQLKIQGIASSNKTTWLTLRSNTIYDQNSQPLLPLVNGINASRVQNYTQDDTRPILEIFHLNLTDNTLTMQFSETVNVIDTLNVTALTILADPNLDSVGRFHRLGIDTNTLSYDVYTPVVTIQLGRLDLNEVKKDIYLATSKANTHLALDSTALSDMNFNPVVARSTLVPLQVTNYIEDKIAPELEAFDLDMDASTMVLYFSETVNPTTLDLSQFLFQPAESVLANYTDIHSLTGGVASTANPTPLFTVTINVPDLNDLKRLPFLATNENNTYIRLFRGGIQDMNENHVSSVPQDLALRVANYTTDTTRPELVSFDLNACSERLILTFSETVNSSSLNVTRIVIQESRSATEPYLRRLVGGIVLTLFDTVVEIQLGSDDLNYIKWVPNLATSISNTYISFEDTTVEDMFGNLVIGIDSAEARIVRNYTEDNRNPVLLNFDLDMDKGTIDMTFNETVDVSSLNVNSITIQNDISLSTNTTFHVFTDVNTSSNSLNRPVVTINIGNDDLNEIKRLSDLAISQNTTFLNLTYLAIADTNSNNVTPITLPVTSYINDTTDPVVTNFAFDLNTGQIEILFSETVSVSSLNTTQISLQSMESVFDTSMMAHSFTLTGGVVLTVGDNATVTVELLKPDLDALKAIPIATERGNTFLSVTTDFILDMNDNAVVLIPPDDAIVATKFTNDTTRPFLEEYSIDLNAGLITLTFSETVNTNTINLTQLTLQDARTANSTFQLTSSSHSLELQPIVTVFISKSDLDLLKQNREVATSRDDTFLTHTNFTVDDMAGNEVYSIPNGSGVRPQSYTQDITAPQLEKFDFDVDSGVLVLYYSETIDIYSFNHTLVTLQSSSNISLAEHSFVLRNGYILPNDSTVAYFTLSTEDLNEVKRLVYVGTCTSADTYLSLLPDQVVTDSYLQKPGVNQSLMMLSTVGSGSSTSGSGTQMSGSGSGVPPEGPLVFSAHIYDMFGNPVQSIWNQDALFVSDCVIDTTSPKLLNFTLNLQNDTLILTFDETVNASSLNVTQITLYSDSPDANDTQLYQLQSSYTTVGNLSGQVIIEMTLSNADLNEIKRRSYLATNEENTRISLTNYFILDMNGNWNTEILPENALPAQFYIPDGNSPTLVHFELDMTLEALTLSFSETVNASSLNVDGITILNENSTSNHTLQEGMFVIHNPMNWADDPVIVIDIDDSDLNLIKSIRDLATDDNDTSLSIETFTIADMNGNLVNPINTSNPIQVFKYTPDTIRPELVSFDLNIDSFELFLTFSETVDVSTLNVSAIYMQPSNHSLEEERFSFTVGNESTFSTSNDWPEIIVNIGVEDMNEIKRRTDLATSNVTTFLTLSDLAINDMNENDVMPILNGNSIQVTDFTPDATNPQLENFSINLNAGYVQLTFDETVNFSSLNFTSLFIINSRSPTESISLGGGNTTNERDSTIIEFLFTIEDLNTIKRIRSLATSVNNSYIALENRTILDMNDNPIDAIPPSAATMALRFVPDTSYPHLVNFNLDMDVGTLYLTFNETVEASSLNVSEITLQDNAIATSNITYTITGGVASIEDSTVIELDFSFFDINEIKKIRGLASNETGSNTYLTLSNLTVMDMNDNPVVPIPDGMGKKVWNFTQDTTSPELVSFDLDMDIGLLVFNFSETVDTLTFNITQFTLQGTENVSSNPMATDIITLSQRNLLTGDEVIIEQGLLYFDLNTIKALGHLATSPNDTYLSLSSYAIQDMVGNSIDDISEFDALPVTYYASDINRPMLESFDLDMDNGQLDFTFTETVNISTLDVTEITLLSHERNASQQFRFSVESSSSDPDWPYFKLNIGLNDLNTIKARDILATRNETTLIDLSEFVIRDTAGNMNLPTDNVTRVSNYTFDTTRPELLEFDLDLTLDILTLRFNETVNVDTFNATQLTLIMSRVSIDSYRETDLSANESASGSGSGSGNAGSGSGSGSGNRLGSGLASGSGSGSASRFGNESVEASVQFGEVVPETVNYTLTGGTLLSLINATQIKLKLSFEDRNEIKRLLDLAVSNDTTYLSITSALIEDTASNAVWPINTAAALQVTNFIADYFQPQLRWFDLDMDGPTLTLYLSETVNVSSLNVSAIVLQSTNSSVDRDTQYHMLTPGPAPLRTGSESENGPVVVINIGEEDANRIKFLTQLAQDDNSTYLSFSQDALKDTNGNEIVEELAVQVNNYYADNTGPILRNFSLNLTSELLTLVFDETVDFSTIRAMLVMLNASSLYGQSYRLTAAVPVGPNSHILVLNLTATQRDLNELKLLTELAVDRDSTYIILSDGTISDLSLQPNYIISSPLTQAEEFYPDTISPNIIAFNVNINAGTVTLVFDEVVNSSSLDPTALTIQNSSNGSGSYYQLSGELIRVCTISLASKDTG